MKKFMFSFVLILTFGCESPDDFKPSSLIDLINIEVRSNNVPADGISRIQVIAAFSEDFSTEDDQKIEFTVFKDSLERSSQDLVFTLNNGVEERISELFVVHNRPETLRVKATASVNGVEFSKTTDIVYEMAYPEEINVLADSLVINPNSFKELKITTELLRSIGKVNSGIIAETIVVDTLGNERGLFNNYQNKIREIDSGKIENRFTLGNDDYTGRLFVIVSTQTATETVGDSIVIFSKNN